MNSDIRTKDHDLNLTDRGLFVLVNFLLRKKIIIYLCIGVANPTAKGEGLRDDFFLVSTNLEIYNSIRVMLENYLNEE